MRGLKGALGVAMLMVATGCAHAESGISFLGDPQTVSFAMDRGEGWEAVRAHEGAFDSRTYDYPLTPGETVRVRVTAGGAEVVLPVTAEDDIAFGMVASIASEDPTAMCMGCGVPASAPVDPATPDGERLWLYVTFNGISAPIMF